MHGYDVQSLPAHVCVDTSFLATAAQLVLALSSIFFFFFLSAHMELFQAARREAKQQGQPEKHVEFEQFVGEFLIELGLAAKEM